MLKDSSGVTSPKGFLASSVYCGLKTKGNLFENKKDLSLIFSVVPARAAGVFTTNKIQAAPVEITKRHIKTKTAQAIIANSGNANCCCGPQAVSDALSMAKFTARGLNIKTKDVLVASTGVIGKPLELSKIALALPELISGLNTQGGLDAASGIMTTDKKPKLCSVRFKIGKKNVTIGGIAKGAGMISPCMATMLAFITTDAKISQSALGKAFSNSVTSSFNCITVDGEMSTNDTTLIMANGLAENKCITIRQRKEFDKFQKALTDIMDYLAESIVRDGEGASKLIEVIVESALSKQQADIIARAVANSSLVKTAMYGNDPNFGRILAKIGSTGTKINLKKLDIYINGFWLFKKGNPKQNIDQEKIKRSLSKDTASIRINLNLGSSQTKIKVSDLTEGYIKLNAKYTT